MKSSLRARPVLARVLERIGKGDTLVVVRIDRLAPIRSDGSIRFASSDPP
jgi:DNA invertase Pin-like site-specific DNA recombinase